MPDEGAGGFLDWRIPDDLEIADHRCRAFSSGRSKCPNRPVAVLLRGSRRTRYFYCADHMYGRWIEDGHVVMWAQRRIETPS